MKIITNMAHTFTSFINTVEVVNFQNKQIAIIAIAAFALLTACYLAFTRGCFRSNPAQVDRFDKDDPNLARPIKPLQGKAENLFIPKI